MINNQVGWAYILGCWAGWADGLGWIMFVCVGLLKCSEAPLPSPLLACTFSTADYRLIGCSSIAQKIYMLARGIENRRVTSNLSNKLTITVIAGPYQIALIDYSEASSILRNLVMYWNFKCLIAMIRYIHILIWFYNTPIIVYMKWDLTNKVGRVFFWEGSKQSQIHKFYLMQNCIHYKDR